MADTATEQSSKNVSFVYDGDCPLCTSAAHALQIKQAVGDLHLLNARENVGHALLSEITERGLDLDEGMVVIYAGEFYHGEDALHMMALLGSNKGWFNRINAMLFRNKTLARLCYPSMRAVRNLLLRIKGAPKIRNLTIDRQQPLFKAVFGKAWDDLPPVMHKHYAIRPFSNDMVKVEGHLDVKISPLVSLIARTTGMLLAHSGENVPVTVVFKSDSSGAFHFERIFHFRDKGDIKFYSRMEWIKDNILVEFMRFGMGWKLAYDWDGEKIILSHQGYVWRLFGITIPLPTALLIGKGHAEETPLDENRFSMWTNAMHPLFGKTFGYAGEFKVTEVSCDPS